MNRFHLSTVALLLAVSTSAWAGGGLYPASMETAATTTRAQVAAELDEAQRLGLMSSVERFPSYRTPDVTPGEAFIVWGDAGQVVLRAKVRAETQMASRFGLLNFGEGDPPIATAEQESLIAAAGQRAVERARMA
jgi:hypothetical protein